MYSYLLCKQQQQQNTLLPTVEAESKEMVDKQNKAKIFELCQWMEGMSLNQKKKKSSLRKKDS